MELKLWYSVRSGGDGSAYPTFMESEELCRLDQEFNEDEWGEVCVGSITLHSDSKITINRSDIETIDDIIKDLEENIYCSDEEDKKLFKNHLKK